jgi:hypothetical protein
VELPLDSWGYPKRTLLALPAGSHMLDGLKNPFPRHPPAARKTPESKCVSWFVESGWGGALARTAASTAAAATVSLEERLGCRVRAPQPGGQGRLHRAAAHL